MTMFDIGAEVKISSRFPPEDSSAPGSWSLVGSVQEAASSSSISSAGAMCRGKGADDEKAGLLDDGSAKRGVRLNCADIGLEVPRVRADLR